MANCNTEECLVKIRPMSEETGTFLLLKNALMQRRITHHASHLLGSLAGLAPAKPEVQVRRPETCASVRCALHTSRSDRRVGL